MTHRRGAASAPLEVIDLGRRSYADVHALQQQRVDARVREEVCDALFLVEHDAVITRGRRSPEGDTAGVPFPVVSIERGGEATYHGPGQLVAYPIILLPEGRHDLHRYLRDLEGVVIDVLSTFAIQGRREDGWTGVWIGDSKVCSIGVAVRRWVTWHGLALNVTTDLDAFRTFEPCGLRPDVMTRLVDHLPSATGWAPTDRAAAADDVMARAKSALVGAFCSAFDLEQPR